MNETEMNQTLLKTFEGVDVTLADDNSFYFYNPDDGLPPDHMFPFATLMVNDVNDPYSDLSRPGIYRLNIGVSKQTFQGLFAALERPKNAEGAEQPPGGYDYTAQDQLMPHPVYNRQYWVSILNPSAETFEKTVRPLLEEAYQAAVSKRKNNHGNEGINRDE